MENNDYITEVIKLVIEAEELKKQVEESIENLKSRIRDELDARDTDEIRIEGWTVKRVPARFIASDIEE